MEVKEQIVRGKTALGIELGSTRIKAVLVDNCGKVLAAGIHDWENSLINNIWTYSLDEIHQGIESLLQQPAPGCGGKIRGSPDGHWSYRHQRYDAWLYGAG